MAAVPPRNEVDIDDLAAIATSGSASDLTAGTAPTARLGSGTATSAKALFGDSTWKTLAAVAQSGAAADVSGLADVATSGAAADVSGLADVATSGAAADVSGLADVATSGAAADVTGLAAIATSGSASDLGAGTVATARLGSGSASSSTYLRGDQTWSTVAGGGATGSSAFLVAASDADPDIIARADYVCDGTDDHVQISAALARGPVQLSDGIFYCADALWLKCHGGALVGTGRYYNSASLGGKNVGTLIKLTAGFAGDYGVRAETADAIDILSHPMIRDLSIDGSAYTATPVDGYLMRGFQFFVLNVFCTQMSGHGARYEGRTGGLQWDTYDGLTEHLLSTYNTLSGVFMGDGAADQHFYSPILAYNTRHGMEYIGGSSTQIFGIHCYGNQMSGISMKNGGSRTKIVGGKIEGNYNHGILFDGSDAAGSAPSAVQITGCGFVNNGRAATNTYSNIKCVGTRSTDKLTITGCSFETAYSAITERMLYHIDLSFYGVTTTISGCHFQKSATFANTMSACINIANDTVLRGLTVSGCYGYNDWKGTAIPTVAAGANAGTSPPTPTVATGGTDYQGQIGFGSGSGPAAGAYVVVTYSEAQESQTYRRAHVTPANAAAGALAWYVASETASGFTIALQTAAAASQAANTYLFNYVVR